MNKFKIERDDMIKDVLLIKSKTYSDVRGYTYELCRDSLFRNISFVEDKISISHKNVLRGLHNSSNTAKLVCIVSGRTYHVQADMRRTSSSYLKVSYHEFNAQDSSIIIFVPIGVANGFYTLEDNTIVLYKLTNYYENCQEDIIKWNDPRLNIKWPFDNIDNVIISDKDKQGSFIDFSREKI